MRTLLIAVVVGAGIAGCELKAQERRPVPEEILQQKSKLALEALYEKCFREMPNIQGVELFSLLENRAVRSELRVSMEMAENIRLVKRSKFAELSEILRNLEKIPNASEMRQAATKQNKEELLHDLRGLLTATQRKRLDEIAHYCEIAFYGLDVALADGNLGRELAITENQRTSVRDRTNRLMRESEAALVELRRATHEKVLALLPDDQKSKAIELLGDFFDFHYGEWQRYRDVLADLEIVAKQSGITIAEAGKNRNLGTSFEFGSKSLRELLYYLSNSAIRSQLELSREQVKLIRKLIDDSQSVDEKVSSVEYLTNAVDEVLNPRQQARLRQIGFFIEIGSCGYGKVFTGGSLGRAIGVTPAQFPEIEKRCNELEQSLASETQRIRQSCFNAALEKLTLEQRRKAREILGEYFEFPKSHFAYEHEQYKLLLELKE